MPPVWPFTALSAAWRKRCATTDDRGLSAAMDAFVDRAPIDWTALKASLRVRDDRTLADALQAIDRVRGAERAARAREAPPRRPAIRLLIALAALQTISSLLLSAPYALPLAGGGRTMPLLLAVAFGCGALVLGVRSARDGRRIFLLGFLVCCAAAFARAALLALPAGPPPWLRFLWLEMFAPAFLWQFALDFPRVERFTRFDVIARRTSALVWTLGAVAAAANIGVAAALVPEDAIRALLPNDRSNLYWRVYTFATVLAVGAILVRTRRAPRAERRRVARLAAALGAGTAPLLLLGIARTAVPALDRWLSTVPAGRSWAMPAIGTAPAVRSFIDAVVVFALLATPLLIGIAVVVDRPFDRQQRRTPLARRLLRRATLWSAARHRRQLAAALAALRTARGTREICRIVARALGAGLDVPIVRVLVSDGDGFADCLGSATSAPGDAAFVAMLRASSSPITVDPGGALSGVLPAREQRWLEDESIQLAVAITARDRALAAIVIVGSPGGGASFNRRDLWFVDAIASAASAVWTEDDAAPVSETTSRHAPPDTADRELAFECPRCGVVSAQAPIACGCNVAPDLAAVPARLGAYTVRRRLGAGGMGVVYLGRDVRLNRDVALKTLPAVAPGAIARLQGEARAMASLNHHAIATIYGLEVWRDVPVLVCEYFANGTLSHRLAASGPLAPADTIRLGTVLARGLECMHAGGLLHGDIKPANVGLTSRDDPKLLDFGLSRLVDIDDTAVRRHAQAGTLAYLSPEALRGHAPAAAFDLWALAIMLLECLAGRNPMARDTESATRRAILDANPSVLAAQARAAHPLLGAWLERALGPVPGRIESAAALSRALERLSLDAGSGDHRE